MKWSLKLGRILGIDVYLHLTFLLLLAFIGVSHLMAGGSVTSAMTGVGFFVALFVCVLLHEFGHALMARRDRSQTFPPASPGAVPPLLRSPGFARQTAS
jgi:Zn-dependent protease